MAMQPFGELERIPQLLDLNPKLMTTAVTCAGNALRAGDFAP